VAVAQQLLAYNAALAATGFGRKNNTPNYCRFSGYLLITE
jgi:hypothetical protein